MKKQFDICIIGAGMAGATIAAYLAPKGINIALIDRNYSEKNRIVGELLQPGAVLMLEKMGLAHLLEGIDGQMIEGYALLQDDEDFSIPYSHDKQQVVEGIGLHNGRFLQKIRTEALAHSNVTQITGNALELLLDENETITGVNYRESKHNEEHSIHASLTIISDGFFSKFRSDLTQNKTSVTSYFIGMLLKDCPLPHAHHGHVFLSGPTPFLCYPVGNNEVRILIDFAGSKAPSKGENLQNYLKSNVTPYIPEMMKASYEQAVNEAKFKMMPNHYMPAKPLIKKGAVMLGDSLNMRHPLTGGGLTAVFSDIYLLSNQLLSLSHFDNQKLLMEKVKIYYKQRHYSNANVNILANALYGVMSNKVLKKVVYEYLRKGGNHSQVPITLLAGLNRNQKTLISYFFSAILFGAGKLFRQNPLNIGKVIKMLIDALTIIMPLLKNELSVKSIFSHHLTQKKDS